MRRFPLVIALGAVALATPLAACGGDDDSSASSTTSGDGPALTVHAKDSLKFDAEAYEVAAGEVTFTYVNDGQLAHTLLIKGKSGFELEVGGKDVGSVELGSGTYTLYCDVTGHEAAGMVAKLTVK